MHQKFVNKIVYYYEKNKVYYIVNIDNGKNFKKS